jgi:hypothetical protein
MLSVVPQVGVLLLAMGNYCKFAPVTVRILVRIVNY